VQNLQTGRADIVTQNFGRIQISQPLGDAPDAGGQIHNSFVAPIFEDGREHPVAVLEPPVVGQLVDASQPSLFPLDRIY
jgi:hypothetical protein